MIELAWPVVAFVAVVLSFVAYERRSVSKAREKALQAGIASAISRVDKLAASLPQDSSKTLEELKGRVHKLEMGKLRGIG